MMVTDVQIRRVDSDKPLKAYVNVTFDDCFVVHNLKIIEGKSGLFVAMPNRRTGNGAYKDIAHPITTDFRKQLVDRVLEVYSSDHEAD